MRDTADSLKKVREAEERLGGPPTTETTIEDQLVALDAAIRTLTEIRSRVAIGSRRINVSTEHFRHLEPYGVLGEVKPTLAKIGPTVYTMTLLEYGGRLNMEARDENL